MSTIIINKLKDELVFIIVLLLTLATSFMISPHIETIDWKVIFSLFNLMLIAQALEKYHLLDKIALSILKKFQTPRNIALAMIGTTAFIAMFITNDVALITVVPLTIIIAKRANFDPYRIIVLETAAANIGSSLTPFGNPQNLYLYTYYHINTKEFLHITLPVVLIGLFFLLIINLFNHRSKLTYTVKPIIIEAKTRLLLYLICFILVILSILRLLNYQMISVIILFIFLCLDKNLIFKVDYFLLGTFLCFFIFIDNITRIGAVQAFAVNYLTSPYRVLSIAALLSQCISNVPAAILLSPFTHQYSSLLVGVSVGGLGTMIASLANLISFKLYIKNYSPTKYRVYFYAVNSILFLVMYLFLTINPYH